MFRSKPVEEQVSFVKTPPSTSFFSHLLPPFTQYDYTLPNTTQPGTSNHDTSSSSKSGDMECNDESEISSSMTTVLEKAEQIEIVDEQGKVTMARTNLKASDVFKLANGLRILVHVNEFGQPIRASRRVLTRYMSKLIREPNLCPPDMPDFNDVKKAFGIVLIRAIRDKFSFPNHERVDYVLLSMMSSKFRNNKYRIRKDIHKQTLIRLRGKLKKVLEDSNVPSAELERRVMSHQFCEEDIMHELNVIEPPPGFAYHQWLKFQSGMKSEKAKELSKKGKKARATMSHFHTTGTKSYA